MEFDTVDSLSMVYLDLSRDRMSLEILKLGCVSASAVHVRVKVWPSITPSTESVVKDWMLEIFNEVGFDLRLPPKKL